MNLLLFILLIFISITKSEKVYKVVAQRFSNFSIINRTNSDWQWNYNAALFTDFKEGTKIKGAGVQKNQIGVMVRVQNSNSGSDIYSVGPSYIAIGNITFDSGGMPVASEIRNLTLNSTYIIPNNSTESHGAEDPRINNLNGVYHLFYTAYNGAKAMLASATTQTPWIGPTYQRKGEVFPKRDHSKSGATLFATLYNKLSKHYLFWGDTNIGIATSTDSINWYDNGTYLMHTRSDHFDSNLIESGPSPLQLKSGDYLFIYNSAEEGYPSVKPGWKLKYNVGFAILSQTDPTRLVQRSDQPILSPELEWEVGNVSGQYLTPNVVFVEGLVPDPNGCPSNVGQILGNNSYAPNAECFFGVYGASDSELGAVRIISSWVESNSMMRDGMEE